MKIPTLIVANVCSAKGCKLKPTKGVKLSDFWVMSCTRHLGVEFGLDFTKIFSVRSGPVIDSDVELKKPKRKGRGVKTNG